MFFEVFLPIFVISSPKKLVTEKLTFFAGGLGTWGSCRVLSNLKPKEIWPKSLSILLDPSQVLSQP